LLTLRKNGYIIGINKYQKVVSNENSEKGEITMILGYARVSTDRQELDIQLKALKEAGATKIYKEKISGAKVDRKELNNLLETIKAGDTLIVTKADRIARSLSQLEKVVTDLTNRGVSVHIINMGMFTTETMANPMTKLLFNVLGAFAEFERDMILERTQEGIQNAREKGVKFGRKSKKYVIEGSLLHAIEQVEEGKISQPEGAKFAKCSVATFKRRLKEYREQNKGAL
jgi:DNA invertase Pin-like site-specific DNA recombinase